MEFLPRYCSHRLINFIKYYYENLHDNFFVTNNKNQYLNISFLLIKINMRVMKF